MRVLAALLAAMVLLAVALVFGAARTWHWLALEDWSCVAHVGEDCVAWVSSRLRTVLPDGTELRLRVDPPRREPDPVQRPRPMT